MGLLPMGPNPLLPAACDTIKLRCTARGRSGRATRRSTAWFEHLLAISDVECAGSQFKPNRGAADGTAIPGNCVSADDTCIFGIVLECTPILSIRTGMGDHNNLAIRILGLNPQILNLAFRVCPQVPDVRKLHKVSLYCEPSR